eukprot:jgi/Psemu1/312165/fgenesh1_kg.892_\
MTASPITEERNPAKPTKTPSWKATKSNRKIHHVTEINAPIEDVWKALVDVNNWSWNKWTRLEAGTPAVGLQGTLLACYEGDDNNWQTFQFEFAEVDPSNHVLAWQGSVGPLGGRLLFKGYHSMRLEEIEEPESNTSDEYEHKRHSTSKPSKNKIGSTKRTRLVHTETFRGILPFFHLGLPYETLNRNYRLMNESLKKFVEDQSCQSEVEPNH